jgi:hypothetical protein
MGRRQGTIRGKKRMSLVTPRERTELASLAQWAKGCLLGHGSQVNPMGPRGTCELPFRFKAACCSVRSLVFDQLRVKLANVTLRFARGLSLLRGTWIIPNRCRLRGNFGAQKVFASARRQM